MKMKKSPKRDFSKYLNIHAGRQDLKSEISGSSIEKSNVNLSIQNKSQSIHS